MNTEAKLTDSQITTGFLGMLSAVSCFMALIAAVVNVFAYRQSLDQLVLVLTVVVMFTPSVFHVIARTFTKNMLALHVADWFRAVLFVGTFASLGYNCIVVGEFGQWFLFATFSLSIALYNIAMKRVRKDHEM